MAQNTELSDGEFLFIIIGLLLVIAVVVLYFIFIRKKAINSEAGKSQERNYITTVEANIPHLKGFLINILDDLNGDGGAMISKWHMKFGGFFATVRNKISNRFTDVHHTETKVRKCMFEYSSEIQAMIAETAFFKFVTLDHFGSAAECLDRMLQTPLYKLEEICLALDNIDLVEFRAFDYFPTLKHLTLFNINGLTTEIVEESAQYLPKLEELDLTFNEIKQIPNLQKFSSLKVLNVSYCPLLTLEGPIHLFQKGTIWMIGSRIKQESLEELKNKHGEITFNF